MKKVGIPTPHGTTFCVIFFVYASYVFVKRDTRVVFFKNNKKNNNLRS